MLQRRTQPKPERPARAWPGVQSFAPAVRCDGAAAVQPKSVQHRNRHLLDMARGQQCLLMVPACCNHRLDTTVAAHSNWAIHGKAGARKANDFYVVNSCACCHAWLDAGPATKAQKQAVFMAAHLRQVLAWRQIAGDSRAPSADRKATLWALEQLGALPGIINWSES
jgi:hypothetical protein